MAATIGRVLLMKKGNYSGSTVYNSLDWVRDNGAAWVCKVDGTIGIAPPTLPVTSNANWQVLAIDGSVSGSIAWSSVSGKPFDDIKVGGGLNVDGSRLLELDTSMLTGSNISYDNTLSGLTATQVQDAIDELANGGGGGSYTASTGVKLVGSDMRADLKSNTASSLTATSKGTTLSREYAVGLDANNNLSVNIPWTDTTPNDGTLTIQQNGTTKGTFTADQSGNTSINLQTTEEVATASVSSGSITFTGVDDTTSGGYDVYFDITSSSTNKSPYAKLTTVSGEGTASMTLVYDTDADNGTNTAHLYKVK